MTIWKPAFVPGLLVSAALLAAHPGHEYYADGTISKVRSPHFDVTDKDGPAGQLTSRSAGTLAGWRCLWHGTHGATLRASKPSREHTP